jgi:hypothetical protein
VTPNPHGLRVKSLAWHHPSFLTGDADMVLMSHGRRAEIALLLIASGCRRPKCGRTACDRNP